MLKRIIHQAQLGKAYQTAGVLFEVFCPVNKSSKLKKIIASAKDVQEKEIYTPYNILPLDAAGASQSIMQLEEISMGRLLSYSQGNMVCFYVPKKFQARPPLSAEVHAVRWPGSLL